MTQSLLKTEHTRVEIEENETEAAPFQRRYEFVSQPKA